MNKDEFESAVLELWVQTTITLTMANLQYVTKMPRRKVRVWADALVADGFLEMDSDADGEPVFSVPGAQRNKRGPKSFAELERLRGLQDDVSGRRRGKGKRNKSVGSLEDLQSASTALVLADSARREIANRGRSDVVTHDGERKSLLLSAGLSLFFGPLGWFYAGSLREAAVGSVGFIALASLLPSFLMLPLLTILMPMSGLAGLVYAWQHNRHGGRGRILGDDDD